MRIDANHKATMETKLTGKASTSSEYREKNYPQATIFQDIIKSVAKGIEPADDSKEMFDPVTGKTYVPFAKSIKLDSQANLQLSGMSSKFVPGGIPLSGSPFSETRERGAI